MATPKKTLQTDQLTALAPTRPLNVEEEKRAHQHVVDFLQMFKITREEAELMAKRLRASGLDFFHRRAPR